MKEKLPKGLTLPKWLVDRKPTYCEYQSDFDYPGQYYGCRLCDDRHDSYVNKFGIDIRYLKFMLFHRHTELEFIREEENIIKRFKEHQAYMKTPEGKARAKLRKDMDELVHTTLIKYAKDLSNVSTDPDKPPQLSIPFGSISADPNKPVKFRKYRSIKDELPPLQHQDK